MKRHLATMAAVALAAGLTAAAAAAPAPAAGAAPAAGPAAKPAIRTYTDTWNMSQDGLGADKGWFYHSSYKLHVVLIPRLAFSADTVEAYIGATGNVNHFWKQWHFVGGHNYIKNSDAPQWKKSTPTAKEIRADAAAADIWTGIARLRALPGLHLVGA